MDDSFYKEQPKEIENRWFSIRLQLAMLNDYRFPKLRSGEGRWVKRPLDTVNELRKTIKEMEDLCVFLESEASDD